jgi:putative transposase
MTKRCPCRHLKTTPKIIRPAVTTHNWFPLSLRYVNDPLPEIGIDICHDTVWFWLHLFGPKFAAKTIE